MEHRDKGLFIDGCAKVEALHVLHKGAELELVYIVDMFTGKTAVHCSTALRQWSMEHIEAGAEPKKSEEKTGELSED